MKVIAVIPKVSYQADRDDKFIVEISREEINNFAGFHYYKDVKVEVGRVIDIGKIYKFMEAIVTAPRKMSEVKEQILAISKLLSMPQELIDAAESQKGTE